MNATPTHNNDDLENELTRVHRLEREVSELEDQLRRARNKLDNARSRLAKEMCKGPILGMTPKRIARRSTDS